MKDDIGADVFLWGFYVVIGVPVAIILVQAYVYLRDGFWPGFSVIDAIGYFSRHASLPSDLVTWAQRPSSWYGLHKILVSTPFAFFIFAALGILWFVLGLPIALLLHPSDWRREPPSSE